MQCRRFHKLGGGGGGGSLGNFRNFKGGLRNFQDTGGKRIYGGWQIFRIQGGWPMSTCRTMKFSREARGGGFRPPRTQRTSKIKFDQVEDSKFITMDL